MRKSLIIIILFINTLQGYCQVNPPCGLDYGTSTDETNIVTQMRYGTITDAINAINQGKNSRGNSLGCPQLSLTYISPDTTEPLLSDIENIWNTVHSPAISSYTINCPRIGRYENNSALGAYYALQAGYFLDTTKLAEIGNMMYDQQYASWNISSPNIRNEGVYAYLNVPNTNPCYLGGVVGSSVTTLCNTLPQYCETYSNGQFSGNNFATSGQDDANNWFDGGLAYDHGWVGVQMIEASISQNNITLKQKYRNSLELAGQYAISEFPVKNHNYTAKLIWLLAELYAWTGDAIYKNELNYKLDKNLIPGILWDENNDGFVDGTSPQIAFSDLTSTAQTSGRMWDGHNSLPWYQAMNTWAIVEAYIAFRDRGETARANQLKPYAVAMLDNLADEIINQGIISPDQLGVRDITYALLIGVWKIAQYENETHTNWNNAAWAMWNSGYFNAYSTHSVCVGLYLLVKSNTLYNPIVNRDSFILGINDTHISQRNINVYPNPTNNIITIDLHEFINYDNTTVNIYNSQGRLVMSKYLTSELNTIDFQRFSKGVYFIRINFNENINKNFKIVKVN